MLLKTNKNEILVLGMTCITLHIISIRKGFGAEEAKL